MYAISATAEIQASDCRGWNKTRQFPTFYLDKNVQGICTEGQAIEVARMILNPSNDRNTKLNICAVEI